MSVALGSCLLPRVACVEHYAKAYFSLYSGHLTPTVSSPQASPMEVVNRLPPHDADDRRVYGETEILTPSREQAIKSSQIKPEDL